MEQELARMLQLQQQLEEARPLQEAESRQREKAHKLAELERMAAESEGMRRQREQAHVDKETSNARLMEVTEQVAQPAPPIETKEDLELGAQLRQAKEKRLQERLRLQQAETERLAAQREEQLQRELLARKQAAEDARHVAHEAQKREEEDACRADQHERVRQQEEASRRVLEEVEREFQVHIDAMKDEKRKAEWERNRALIRVFARKTIRTSVACAGTGGYIAVKVGGMAIGLAGSLARGLWRAVGGTAQMSKDLTEEMFAAFGTFLDAKAHLERNQLTLPAPPTQFLLHAPYVAPPLVAPSPAPLALPPIPECAAAETSAKKGIASRIGGWVGAILPGSASSSSAAPQIGDKRTYETALMGEVDDDDDYVCSHSALSREPCGFASPRSPTPFTLTPPGVMSSAVQRPNRTPGTQFSRNRHSTLTGNAYRIFGNSVCNSGSVSSTNGGTFTIGSVQKHKRTRKE